MPRDVFVSHASEDHALAEQVCELLEQRGLKCWIAPRDVGAGAEWDEAILDAIERCRAYLLILSAHANRSSFVKNELNRAFSVKKPIVTFRIEDVLPGRSLELYLARHHWTDAFPPPLELRVDQLASSLTRLLNPSADGSVDAPPTPVVTAPKPARVTAVVSRIVGMASGRVSMAAFAVAVAGMIAFALPALRHLRETPPPLPLETRLDIVTPATDDPSSFALSPDGKQIVFVASGDDASRLWLRSLSSTTTQPLSGTEGATKPFWSPDSRSIGFSTNNALKRLDLGGGAPRTLAPVLLSVGGSWSTDGTILFASPQIPLMRVSATGGEVTAVTMLGTPSEIHRQPVFLPDGRRFLFHVGGTADKPGIYLGSLDGSASVWLANADSLGGYLPSGWLLWGRAGTLVAQRLDLEQATLTGEIVAVANGVTIGALNWHAVSVGTTGLVAYRTGGSGLRQLTWVDRSGKTLGIAVDPDGNNLRIPRVSPDGRVAVARTVQGNEDLWLLDGARMSRLTFSPDTDIFPVWSPDGMQIAFRSNRAGPGNLYRKPASGVGVEERLVASDRLESPTSWSADGRFLLYSINNPATGLDLWILPMTGERTPAVFLNTRFDERSGVFSPDGRWVAYQSDESGQFEIYVRPFVAEGVSTDARMEAGQWQVSTAGGIWPLWRPDGKELYFLNPAGEMMAVPIAVTGMTFGPGAPVRLFPTGMRGGGVEYSIGREYDIASDGRFLINTVLDSSTTVPITLIQNWNPQATPQ